MEKKEEAFVIQPFDSNGPYDKRYRDVIEPAVKLAGFSAYRIDHDPSTRTLITDIRRKIDEARFIICEISEDNPNVWFELGYAYARGKDCILLCCKDRREKLPFDIQHESVIFYLAESGSDFSRTRDRLLSKIKAIFETRTKSALESVSNLGEGNRSLDESTPF